MSASIWNPGGSIIPQADPNSQIKSEPFTATEGQTVFTLTQFTYTVGVGALSVFRNGVKLKGSYVTELTNSSFSISACEVGDEIEAVGNTAIADPTALVDQMIVIRDETVVAASKADASADAAAASAASITLPLPITSGGTASITAEEARDNLGVTSEISALATSTTTALLTKVDKTPNGKSVEIPSHSTAERDAVGKDGYFGYNSDLKIFEGYQNGSWKDFVADAFSFAPKNSPTFLGPVAIQKYVNFTDSYGAIQISGVDVARFGGRNGDNSGQLAGFRNILINPRISAGINQREVANWGAVAIGAYGYDRWKKVDASTITQIVEVGNFTPSAVYTYSGNTFSPIQITSPASGNWTLPAISKLETDAQLEEGYIASKHEVRLNEVEVLLCRRYLRGVRALNYYAVGMVGAGGIEGSLICPLALGMRADPALVSTDAGPSIIVGSLSGYISTLVIGNSGSSAYTIASGVGTAGQSCVVRSNSVTFLSAEL